MPLLDKVHAKSEYDVVALSMDPSDRVPVIERIWKKKGLGLAWHRADESLIEELFDVTTLSIPVTIVLDMTGKIESIWQGAVDESKFK
jgi:hypothetical protein